MTKRYSLLPVLIILVFSSPAYCQSGGDQIDYNQTYRYPLSIGFEAQFVSPFTLLGTDYQGNFTAIDLSAVGRLPLPSMPILQPMARLGFAVTRAEYDAANPDLDKFDHTRFYLNGGLGYLHKFNKSLEAGADFEIGMGYEMYPKIDPVGDVTHGAWIFQTSLAGRLSFSPSFNLSIAVRPSLGYSRSLSPLERFNGFVLGLGIIADYRTGTDPDDPRAEIRSIQFEKPRIDDMFAAMQSYYVNNPAGEVTITNTEKYALTDLEVTFFQPGYMNIATSVAKFDQLRPGESLTIPITASFDQNVFNLEGVTPLTGEISVDYTLRTRSARQTIPVTYDLYDKNSLTWDDDRKVAAFITSGDSALGNFLSYLKVISKDVVNSGYSETVQTAIQVYYGLTEIGCLYQRDPTLSYEDAKGDTRVVDSVNLPRETLTKLAGDCDDLTVLYNAMLESSGIGTGFITVPGHIYSIFNTGVPAKDYRLIHPDKSMTVPIDGVLWVPLEITFIGEDDFETAWRAGAEEFHRFVDVEGQFTLYFTQSAQQTYRPVGFQESDLGLQYGDRTRLTSDFRSEVDKITGLVMDSYKETAEELGNKGSYNTYGIVSAQFEDFDRAERAFNNALALDRNYVSPKVNLANVYFLREEYPNALRLFHDAERVLREAGHISSSGYARVLLNLSRTYYEMESFDLAAEYSDKLAEVSPSMADRYAYLADTAGGRAADVSRSLGVQFLEEE
ncbi:MAG: tetratricopeptide repeat protein [Spirochaetaceae bacterium]|nr:tetratricopeptide repeat protein [Spirochaetaceae bacterium]